VRSVLECTLGALSRRDGDAAGGAGRPPDLSAAALGREHRLQGARRGVDLYLPIPVDGALFSAGDPHAAQGDGEVSSTAIETTAQPG
jgi:hypothetical protein